MVNKEKYVGKRLNNFVVVDVVRRSNKKQAELQCLCDCGKVFYMYPTFFNKGAYSSCGCKKSERLVKMHLTHSGSNHPLYQEWRSMISRCHCKDSYNYKDYGARGITVCDEWQDPNNFYEWANSVGGRPTKATLERIDNSKGYCPENCRWATMKEQSRNKRSNIIIEYNGKKQCIQDWAEELGIKHETIRRRYHQGLPTEKVLSVEHLENSGRFKPK